MAYDTAARSRAAKVGWEWRRALAGRTHTPTPEDLARRRIEGLAAALDERAARLYICDVAEAVLPVVAEDSRHAAAAAIAAGRRLAGGGTSGYFRRKAVRAAVAMAEHGCYVSAEVYALRWGINHAVSTLPVERRLDALHDHLAALEALTAASGARRAG